MCGKWNSREINTHTKKIPVIVRIAIRKIWNFRSRFDIFNGFAFVAFVDDLQRLYFGLRKKVFLFSFLWSWISVQKAEPEKYIIRLTSTTGNDRYQNTRRWNQERICILSLFIIFCFFAQTEVSLYFSFVQTVPPMEC